MNVKNLKFNEFYFYKVKNINVFFFNTFDNNGIIDYIFFPDPAEPNCIGIIKLNKNQVTKDIRMIN